MGWTSTADPLENVGRQLYFSSKEEAVTYAGGRCSGSLAVRRCSCGAQHLADLPCVSLFSAAEKNGWEYEIEEYHNANKARPKRYIGYGDK